MSEAFEPVRVCPDCGSARPLSEFACENPLPGGPCLWPLEGVEVTARQADAAVTAATGEGAGQDVAPPTTCVNGHPLGPGDLMCLECGADPAEEAFTSAGADTGEAVSGAASATAAADLPIVAGWRAVRAFAPRRQGLPWTDYEAESGGRRALLTLYEVGHEPDPDVQDLLRRTPLDHVPELLAIGRDGERAYAVSELVEGGTLEELVDAVDGEEGLFLAIVDELAAALTAFGSTGLRHRDLRPATVLVRVREPLDLVVTGFGSARLSDFDLEAVAPLALSRYSAPETIVGAVSAASDWWSLGMILLERATRGSCFAGADDRAFHLHVVTRGVDVPSALDPRVRLLLRGLLARDPLERWSAVEVAAWRRGETPEAQAEAGGGTAQGAAITLGGVAHQDPGAFALAGCSASAWEEARDLTLRGAVATWLEERGMASVAVAEVRRLSSDAALDADGRHALAMMAVNPALPLVLRGDIVTPAWLLANVGEAHALLDSATPHLERLGREPWLVRLRTRAESVRAKAALLGIELDAVRARAALLATSRANLEAERDALRRVLPDSDHVGLASLMAKAIHSEEDLVILVCAAAHQFVPLAPLVDLARTTAASAGVALDESVLAEQLVRPRRELFAALDVRTAGLARCGIVAVDGWVDAFRIERRTTLSRAVTALAVPAERWKAPEHARYVADLMHLFERRISATVGRGALAAFAIGKTTPRLDLLELGTDMRGAESILAHVVARTAAPLDLDPTAWTGEPSRYARLRKLVAHADTFRRDTGIDGRHLAFPFLLHVARNAKPKVLPILLWPVAVAPDGAALTGASIMFDPEREEVRLNPALEGLLGASAFEKYASARNEILSRGALTPADVIDVFGTLAPADGRTLRAVPGRDARASHGTSRLVPAAALFNAEFTGQNVAEDLRALRSIPPTGTALEAALRVASDAVAETMGRVREADRFPTAAGDPSQDEAVLRSRSAPGLVVEGPPGTGKSQTIVNVVTDAIGRGESVLVVCQKQAALTVVQKRLAAEGLADRAFALLDGVRDRDPLLRALREQYPTAYDAARVADLRGRRSERAASIESLEDGLDRAHAALHARDAEGESYRGTLGDLVGVEAEGASIDAPRLRRVLSGCARAGLATLEEDCAPLAATWLESGFEGSALQALRRFPVDDALAQDLTDDLAAFVGAEQARSALPPGPFEIDDPGPLRDWFSRAAPIFEAMDGDAGAWLAATFDLFKDGGQGPKMLSDLRASAARVKQLRDGDHRADLAPAIAGLPAPILRERLEDATIAAAPASGLSRLRPGRLLRRRLAGRHLKELGVAWSEPALDALLRALSLEVHLRPLRDDLGRLERCLGVQAEVEPRPLAALRSATLATLATLEDAGSAAALILACPLPAEGEAMARSEASDAFAAFRAAGDKAAERLAARIASREALHQLSERLLQTWTERCDARISSGASTADLTKPIEAALPTLAAFQSFRARARTLDARALGVFAALRKEETRLRALPLRDIDGVVRRTIRREWLKARKAEAEERDPDLLIARDEVERRVARLARLDDEMRELNRRLLAADVRHTGTSAQWEAVTRLKGARAKRLREVFEEGAALGLMRLRPVWLMSPDVASRILPLRAGLFDLVVFDEASQTPVEHAVPTLFRAKRAVVAGDEKQMPPTAFFGGRLDDDDDEGNEDLPAESATEAERDAAEERWNRRDIQSCPDLLQLARGFLPTVTLQIHYRSRYRELIAFSNAAFYGSALSIPARQPDGEVRRWRPIEVVRADGVYEGQVNEGEAARVVDELASAWTRPSGERPSAGVVTFNRKQADLIEARIAERASIDERFRAALEQERGRRQDGEDMGFFVKNLENVQGDERDVIVFSTTFGFDRRGAFNRLFGVLGQVGGERRLNVAVTRAREKVVLVTSMPVARISDWTGSARPPEKPRDYLQAYLDYAARVSAGELDSARGLARRLGATAPGRSKDEGDGPDGFEASVRAFVERLGHGLVASPSGADAFGLDFAIVDPATGLFGIGIECDAPRHPLLARARGREIWRRSVLARSVARIHRVSSRDWYERGGEERARLALAIEEAVGKREAA